MSVLCAWCGIVLQEGEGSVSHGICAQCAYQVETHLLREIARTRPLQPRRQRRAPTASAVLPGFEAPQPA